MSKKTLSLLLVLCSLSAFACGGYGDLYPKWSIGVIGVGNFSTPQFSNHLYFLPGIQFTHQNPYGTWAQRAGIEHIKSHIETPDALTQGNDVLYYEGTEQRTILRVGIERGWYVTQRLRPYAAVDLAGQFYKSDIDYSGGFGGLNERDEIKMKGIGLMPAIGLKTFVGRKICIYAEYRAEAFLNDVDTKVTHYSGNIDSRPTSEMKFDFSAGTIAQMGVQVMF
jgi:hypothetical protein